MRTLWLQQYPSRLCRSQATWGNVASIPHVYLVAGDGWESRPSFLFLLCEYCIGCGVVAIGLRCRFCSRILWFTSGRRLRPGETKAECPFSHCTPPRKATTSLWTDRVKRSKSASSSNKLTILSRPSSTGAFVCSTQWLVSVSIPLQLLTLSDPPTEYPYSNATVSCTKCRFVAVTRMTFSVFANNETAPLWNAPSNRCWIRVRFNY